MLINEEVLTPLQTMLMGSKSEKNVADFLVPQRITKWTGIITIFRFTGFPHLQK